MSALEIFGFKNYLTGQSDHPADALDGTSEILRINAVVQNFTLHFPPGSGTGCGPALFCIFQTDLHIFCHIFCHILHTIFLIFMSYFAYVCSIWNIWTCHYSTYFLLYFCHIMHIFLHYNLHILHIYYIFCILICIFSIFWHNFVTLFAAISAYQFPYFAYSARAQIKSRVAQIQ
jgi:hypothetical protein